MNFQPHYPALPEDTTKPASNAINKKTNFHIQTQPPFLILPTPARVYVLANACPFMVCSNTCSARAG